MMNYKLLELSKQMIERMTGKEKKIEGEENWSFLEHPEFNQISRRFETEIHVRQN